MCTVNQMKDLVRYSAEFGKWRDAYYAECNKRSFDYNHLNATQCLENAGDYAWAMVMVCFLADVNHKEVCPEAVDFIRDYNLESKQESIKGLVA